MTGWFEFVTRSSFGEQNAMSQRSLMLVACVAAGIVSHLGSPAWAQKTQLPDYPRLNVSRTYRVDPDWPQRPDGLEWDHVPGIFVDDRQQVWIFTRTNPVMVQGAVLAGIPILHRLTPDPAVTIRSGDWVEVDPAAGEVRLWR